MAKRIRNYRKYRSQRVMDAIERDIAARNFASTVCTGVTIDAATATAVITEGRDVFEMARAANAALKGLA
ncbi:MAG TPA: hypothetical protein VFN49_03675 [Candidatus Aquilonibacter sp.]|nr:hypothetical protein [Candidatus Aquilonibacter sp.]